MTRPALNILRWEEESTVQSRMPLRQISPYVVWMGDLTVNGMSVLILLVSRTSICQVNTSCLQLFAFHLHLKCFSGCLEEVRLDDLVSPVYWPLRLWSWVKKLPIPLKPTSIQKGKGHIFGIGVAGSYTHQFKRPAWRREKLSHIKTRYTTDGDCYRRRHSRIWSEQH